MIAVQAEKAVFGLEEALLGFLPAKRAFDPSWVSELRANAAELLRRQGLPNQTEEAWRFTPLRRISGVPFAATTEPIDRSATQARLSSLIHGTSLDVVLANGNCWLSSDIARSGLEVSSLRETLEREPERIRPYLGRLTAKESGFVAANNAAFDDGVCVFVRSGTHVQQPVHIVYAGVPGPKATLVQTRVLLVCEENSELQLLETHLVEPGQPFLTNSVTEIFVGQNARLEHVRSQYAAENAHCIARLAVSQARDSHYISRAFSIGTRLTRLDLKTVLEGSGAECTLDGLYLAWADEHVGHHTVVEHAAPHCTSHQKYKGVVDGRGHAEFDGTIHVQRGAQGTNAHQENRNLVLSDDALVNSKPHLEIDADDVKCSHGATVGKLDVEQLFYLRARGIGEAEARAVLTFAFAKEMTDRVRPRSVRRELAKAVLLRQANPALLEELV